MQISGIEVLYVSAKWQNCCRFYWNLTLVSKRCACFFSFFGGEWNLDGCSKKSRNFFHYSLWNRFFVHIASRKSPFCVCWFWRGKKYRYCSYSSLPCDYGPRRVLPKEKVWKHFPKPKQYLPNDHSFIPHERNIEAKFRIGLMAHIGLWTTRGRWISYIDDPQALPFYLLSKCKKCFKTWSNGATCGKHYVRKYPQNQHFQRWKNSKIEPLFAMCAGGSRSFCGNFRPSFFRPIKKGHSQITFSAGKQLDDQIWNEFLSFFK